MSGFNSNASSSSSSDDGLLGKIVSFFMRGSDPEREKKKLLKDIGKQLKKKKLKYYKPNSKEALPDLGKFFYEIYKVIGPAQVLLENAQSSGVLKTIIIESFLTDEQKDLREKFTEDNIRKRAESTDTKTLAGELKNELSSFFAGFKGDRIKQINDQYNLLLLFLQFVHYDYYFVLKKFDSNIPERDFAYSPKFERINGEYLTDDLKDFLEILPHVTRDKPWEDLFDILQGYKNTEVINRAAWKKLLRQVEQVNKEEMILLIVRHLDGDPYYKPQTPPPDEKIVEEYLSKLKNQTEITIQKILQERQNRKIEKLLDTIFGTTAISRMRNYTDKENLKFSKKMLGGFIYVEPLNYLKAFLLDYFKRDVKELMDLFLIRAKWTTNVTSQQLSEAFHTVMETSDRLLKFDESVGEEGERGSKMKVYMNKSEKDKNATVSLRKVLSEVNEEALGIIQTASQNMIVIGKNLKLILDDYESKPHEVIMNWKELEQYSEEDIKKRITEIYKKLYYFIQLMQYYVKKGSKNQKQQ
jgi:hypothetical protein